MKILLCALNAKFIHTNIAVRFITEYCRHRGINDIGFKEYTINNMEEDIIEDIYMQRPDVVSFSCYIWNITMIKRICSVIRSILPEAVIVLGGPEVSYNPRKVLADVSCDYVISGEGEQSSFDLYSSLENKTGLSYVRGISYKNESAEIISTAPALPVGLADLPFAYSDIDTIENKIFYYEASRGCPFRCQYCLSSIEKGVRFAPIEKVKKELQIFLSKGVRQVKFVDRTFNANNSFALEIMNYIIENDNKITNFHFEAAADLLTDSFLQVLKTARKGLFQLEIGVQSTNASTLMAVSRTGSFEKLSERVNRILSFDNTHVHLDLIAGLPLEDFKSFRKSFNDVYRLRPHQLQLGFLKILHGSGMEEMAGKYGIIYHDYPPYEVLSTDCLSYDDIISLRVCEEMTELYYNSSRFCFSLEYLCNHTESPFDMFMLLGKIKNENTNGNAAHNKNDAYRFMLMAAQRLGNIDMNLFKWIVKLDYILHERPKGTPDWMKDCINLLHTHQINDLLINDSHVHTLLGDSECENIKRDLDKFYIEEMPFNPYTGEKKNVRIVINYKNRDLLGHAQSFLMNV
ncbi:MAG: DUF4080 domain-containing protein [Oscillospiraceae bacterium]|nr:DUF4080 domain-containing protein [Oscillospiraceae bacterium]